MYIYICFSDSKVSSKFDIQDKQIPPYMSHIQGSELKGCDNFQTAPKWKRDIVGVVTQDGIFN